MLGGSGRARRLAVGYCGTVPAAAGTVGQAEPVAAMADPAAWPALWHTPVDWAYETVPQGGAGDAVLPWPRGKVLGGSSGINGLMHVRGDRSSYDAWETAGATG